MTEQILSDARKHAVTASELLESTERFSDQLANMSDDQRLQMAVTGGFTQANQDMRWTVELATAHALAALALAQTETRE